MKISDTQVLAASSPRRLVHGTRVIFVAAASLLASFYIATVIESIVVDALSLWQ